MKIKLECDTVGLLNGQIIFDSLKITDVKQALEEMSRNYCRMGNQHVQVTYSTGQKYTLEYSSKPIEILEKLEKYIKEDLESIKQKRL